MEQITFLSMNHALKAKKILEMNSYTNVNVIKCHTDQGCGFCITVPSDKKREITNILRINNVDFL